MCKSTRLCESKIYSHGPPKLSNSYLSCGLLVKVWGYDYLHEILATFVAVYDVLVTTATICKTHIGCTRQVISSIILFMQYTKGKYRINEMQRR